jgi:hypothetical protein
MDFLICQTSAASPAEPGELLFWFSQINHAASPIAPSLPVQTRAGYILDDLIFRNDFAEAGRVRLWPRVFGGLPMLSENHIGT